MARQTREQIREDILGAASALFASQGFRGTSLQDIAAAVGYSKAALLYHFTSKMAILAELIRPGVEALSQLESQLAGMDRSAAQRAAVDGFVDVAVQYRRECAVIFTNLSALFEEPELADLHRTAEALRLSLCRDPQNLTERLSAVAALAGVAAACADACMDAGCSDPADVSDADLRPALHQIMSRLLL